MPVATAEPKFDEAVDEFIAPKDQVDVETKTDLPAFDVGRLAACASKAEPVAPLVEPVRDWPVSARPLEIGDTVWYICKEHGRYKAFPATAMEQQFADPAKGGPEQWILNVQFVGRLFAARQVKYCGAEWSGADPNAVKQFDCCWCWPGEGLGVKGK